MGRRRGYVSGRCSNPDLELRDVRRLRQRQPPGLYVMGRIVRAEHSPDGYGPNTMKDSRFAERFASILDVP